MKNKLLSPDTKKSRMVHIRDFFSFFRNTYSGLIASVGQTSTQAPSSVHFSASIT